MKIEQLRLRQFRSYDDATFKFLPGMNLIVGVNGTGKSTVLDALRTMLVQALPRLTNIKMRPKSFSINDITNGKDSLTADIQFEHADQTFVYLVHQPNEKYRPAKKEKNVDKRSPGIEEGVPQPLPEKEIDMHSQAYGSIPKRTSSRGALSKHDRSSQVYDLTPRRNFAYLDEYNIRHPIGNIKDAPEAIRLASQLPLAVYYSTRRSLLKESKGSQRERLETPAYAESLRTRELNVQEFSDWWLVQEESGRNDVLNSLQIAVSTFLDNISNVRAVRESDRTLALDRSGASLLLDKAGMTLDVRQLSDGERGMLALALDLARRLVLANPNLSESAPLLEGQAVVLIDELDLHLHPQWQRTIVQRLTKTFPACQFIATTHSPQIIGEVAPENIILLENGKQPYRPDQSLGMDSNWILQVLMGTSDRNVKISAQLEQISDLIEDAAYEQAAAEIAHLRKDMPGDPELVKLQVRLEHLQILGE